MNRFKNKATADAHFEECRRIVDKISEIVLAEGDKDTDVDAEIILMALGSVCGAFVKSCSDPVGAFGLLMKALYAMSEAKTRTRKLS